MRLERRAEGLKNGAKEGTGTVQRDPSGGEHQLRLPLRPCRRQKRCSRGEPKAMDLRHRFANLPKESDVREPDGRSCNGRELRAGFGCGKTQQRGGGDRPDDDEGTGEASSGALGKDSGEAVGGNLCYKPCEEGRNTQNERWQKDAGNPDGTGSLHSADGVAGADADLRSAIQRVELRIPTGAKRTGCRSSRTEVCAGREELGGGYRYHKVLRPRQSRHSDGPDRQRDPGQAGVGTDWEVPARGAMVEGVVTASEEGTPQGGPLSPLLANIYLDAL